MTPRHSVAVRTFAWLGGAAFAASLLFTARAITSAFTHTPGPWTWSAGLPAVLWNACWLTLFASHHSIFARDWAKQWIRARVPPELERPLYVWVASALLTLVVWLWQPVPGMAWAATGLVAVGLRLMQAVGLLITLLAARHLGLLTLAGIRPAMPGGTLKADGLYGVVRHPIYFAWLLLVWPMTTMTGSTLTFAATTTLYLVVAIPLEERSLRAEFGPAYDAYRRVVRWRMLPGVY